MRPRGDVRELLGQALREGPSWPADLAARTGLPVALTRRTLDNMARWGEAMRLDETVRLPHANRPARLYALVSEDAPAPGGEGIDWSLIDCWAAWPAGH